ncbi:MAG: ribosomal RNA small subunit methyltransferase A [Dehalococcoidia bacterium]|nr:ribosomal RNA small subunit methyltransferase A [Dehalococcoidia bacterium]
MPVRKTRRPQRRPQPPPPPELRELGIRARKSLGQHFLTDREVLERIALAAPLSSTQAVLEIGPGLGFLTEELEARGAHITAVEIDDELCAHLQRRFEGRRVRVVCADALEAPPAELLARGGMAPPFGAAGNLPYYITGLLLRRFLEAETRPDWMLFMVQREVAESIVSSPPRMSLLGVSVRFYAEPELLFPVPPSAFYPPPAVDSAVVRLRTHKNAPVDVTDEKAFFDVVRAGFSAPRKQLHNALSRGIWTEPGAATTILERAGIDPMRRAQTLDLAEWGRLHRAFEAQRAAVAG